MINEWGNEHGRIESIEVKQKRLQNFRIPMIHTRTSLRLSSVSIFD